MVVQSLENLENMEKSGKNNWVRENLENLEKSGNFTERAKKKENYTYLRNTRYTGLQTHTERRISYRSYKYIFLHTINHCLL